MRQISLLVFAILLTYQTKPIAGRSRGLTEISGQAEIVDNTSFCGTEAYLTLVSRI